MSLPVRERGLKWRNVAKEREWRVVAPRAGAWVEITPRAKMCETNASLPVRERGLKYLFEGDDCGHDACRSPCGSVG